MSKLVLSAFKSAIEAHVISPRRQTLLLIFLTLTLFPAFAQAPASQAVAVDPALLAKANAGDASSQVMVANAYAAGNGGARDSRQLAADYAQAALWYRKAADQGNTVAQIHLADLYRDGRGVTRDPAQAAAWYRKAAELGDAAAQGTLGILYSVGMGVPHDDVEAYYWLCLASTDQQAAVEDRVAKWQADHPHSAAAQ
jgi:hypothetical protein